MKSDSYIKTISTIPFLPVGIGLLQRQCACGNHTVAGDECAECKKNRLMQQPGFTIQTKFAINQPGDQYEQEADRVAEQIMRMPSGGVSHVSRSPVHIQRMCAACSSGKGLCPKCAEEKKQQLQRKEVNGSKGAENPAMVHEVIGAAGQPLDATTRGFMEPRFGYDFSHVRVHTDVKAAESARAVNALAFTAERHIVFGDNQYKPMTFAGKQLLAHELGHVIQQSNIPSILGIVQRREVCDENGENCQSVPDEEPSEQNYTPQQSSEEPNVSSEVSTAAPPAEEPVTEICTPGNVRTGDGGQEVCNDQGLWQSVPNEGISTQPESISSTPDAGVATDATTSNDINSVAGTPEVETEIGPRPLSLTQSLDPDMLSDIALETEIEIIHKWLIDHLGTESEQEQLQNSLPLLETILANRIDGVASQVIASTSSEPIDPALKARINEIRTWLDSHPAYYRLFDKEKWDRALAILEGPAPAKCEQFVGPHQHPATLSQNAINKIKQGEVLMPNPYVASIGEDVCTFCYGHQMRGKMGEPYCPVRHRETEKLWTELNKEEKSTVINNNNKNEDLYCDCKTECSMDLANKLFAADKSWAIKEVHSKLSQVDLNQDEFDAMVDIVLAVGHIPTDLLDAVKSYWCTDEGKNYVRAYYMTSALKAHKAGNKAELSGTETPGFIKRRQERVWPSY